MTQPDRHARLRRLVALAELSAADAPEPPGEFRVFSLGTMATTKGDLFLDAAGAALVMSAWAAYGNELPFDYDHAMLDPSPRDPAESGKAAGWFVPELREDGIWATRCRWTETAAAKLRAREYRYFSPYLAYDDDNRIVELLNIALTNMPATRGQEPLMPASQTAVVPETAQEATDTTTEPKAEPAALDRRTAELSAKLSFDEIRQAINGALDAMTPPDPNGLSMRPWICEVYDDAVIVEAGGACVKHPYTIGPDGKCSLGAGAKVRREWVPVEPSAAEDDEETKAVKAAIADLLAVTGKATAAEALGLAREKLAPPPPTPEPTPAEKTALKRASDAEAELLALKRADRERVMFARCSALKALPGADLADLARDQIALEDHDPKLAERTFARLAAAHKAVAGTVLAAPLARAGGKPADEDPMRETDRRAEALRKSDPVKFRTIEAARTEVWRRDGQLFTAVKSATMPAPEKTDTRE